jgi:ArsR family transcriptional regulator
MDNRRKPVAPERILGALADKTRLRLLNLMADREICVCYFTSILQESQPKISRHLAYLRRAGLVVARREGKWMHYRIDTSSSAAARPVLDAVLRWLHTDAQMQTERKRLDQACCTPKTILPVRNAPRPTPIKTKRAAQ